MQIKTAFLLRCRGTDKKKEKKKIFSMDMNIQFTFLSFVSSTSPVHGSFIKDEKKLKCRQKGCGQLTLDSDKSPSCRWVLETLDIFSTFSCTKL